MKSNVIEIEGMAHYETGLAVLFSTTGENEDAVWLPKSQIEFDGLGKTTIVIPEWLATEKGLV